MKTIKEIKKYYDGGSLAFRIELFYGFEELQKVIKLLNKKPYLLNSIIKKYQHLF